MGGEKFVNCTKQDMTPKDVIKWAENNDDNDDVVLIMMNWIWSPNYVQNHFLDKRKNGCFSVILAQTSFVVIILMAWTVPPSFVDDGPKFRVLILVK